MTREIGSGADSSGGGGRESAWQRRTTWSGASHITELRGLIDEMDADASLNDPVAGQEHDVDEGDRVWSSTYDRPLRLFPIESSPVHRLIDDLAAGVVVDAACGTGRHSGYLVESGHDVIGIDRSASMLEHASRSVPRAKFLRGELTALPIRAGTADAAACALALVHVPDLDDAFREFARVLRPGAD